MGIADLILNIAGLLLWLNWRSGRFDPLVRRAPATLMGTLRPAAPRKLRRWHLLLFIALLLLLRALIYWWIGAEENWSAKLNLGATVLWFSTNAHWTGFCHMVMFSFLSFGLLLGTFYICLLPLSLLAGPMPIQGLATIPLGRVDGWPRWVRIMLPFIATALLWWLASWPLTHVGVLTAASRAVRFQQSTLLGLSSYLLWKFPIGVILLAHLLNSYIYFGKHPFWHYVEVTARKLLRPLEKAPLKVGKVDFSPVVALAIIFALAELAGRGLNLLYSRLPL
jgi:uncharacterized protein YggT (Ycf19 family)